MPPSINIDNVTLEVADSFRYLGSTITSNISLDAEINIQDLRLNKIAIPNNKFHMASGQGSHWLIKSPTIFSSMCSPPLSYICQFILNIFTLLALTQSFGSLFHSFITLCEKEYFLMSNLHCSLTNAALCPLVLLPSLSLKNIFLSLVLSNHIVIRDFRN